MEVFGGRVRTTDPTLDENRAYEARLSSTGRLLTSSVAQDPAINTFQGMTSLGDTQVAQRYTVLSDSVANGLATFWTTTNANGGTATVSGGEGLVQTSANASGSSQITSTTVTYLPGQQAWFNSAIRLGDTGSVGNTRRWGVFTVSGTTPQDGFYYELSGTTLNAVVAKAGTPTAVDSTAWSRVAASPFTLDTNYHSFEIRWTANGVIFMVDNVARHVVTGTTTPITQTLDFPITIQTINTSGATNRLIAVRNCGIGRFGTPDTFPSPVTLTSTVTPTVTAGAYSAGRIVGGKLTFTNVFRPGINSGILQSVRVTSKTVQTTGLILHLFKADPSNSTWTDTAAPAINAADIPNYICALSLSNASSVLGTVTIWSLESVARAIAASGTSLYGVLTCVGTPTLGSTSDISVYLSVIPD